MVVLGPCYRLGLSRRMRPLRAAGLASAGPGSGPGPGPPRSRGGAVGRAGTRGGGGGGAASGARAAVRLQTRPGNPGGAYPVRRREWRARSRPGRARPGSPVVGGRSGEGAGASSWGPAVWRPGRCWRSWPVPLRKCFCGALVDNSKPPRAV